MARIPDGLYANFSHMSTKQITDYLDNKGIAISKSWDDLWEESHALAKTIAGETRAHIIGDVFNGISKSLAKGKGSTITAKEIAEQLAKAGWYYGHRGGAIQQSLAMDSRDKALNGSVRRLKLIARQNMQSAYMAGRWQRFNENREKSTHLQYMAVMDNRTRAPHAKQHGKVYHIDDPVWNVMFPPNGFNCRCRVRALSEKDLSRKGLAVSKGEIIEDDGVVKQVIDPETGEKSPMTMPRYIVKSGDKGNDTMSIDVGFAYNGGKVQATPFIPKLADITAENDHLTRSLNPSDMLAEGLSAEDYAKAFLAEFGIGMNEIKYFEDVTGEVVPISVDLMTKRSADQTRLKSDKEGRGKYMKLLAMTLKEPDEVWLNWEKEKGDWVLKRHYIRVLDLGQNLFALAVFKRESNKWYGSTVFDIDKSLDRKKIQKYLNDKRKGRLLYRKTGTE